MKLIITALLMLSSLGCIAQVDEDAEPILSPKILALDTTLSAGNRFNHEIGKIAEGYDLAFTDKQTPKTVKLVYKTTNNETLRVEYRYTTDGGDDENANGKPVITYQRINGDVSVIAKIYNFLFGTDIQPGQITAVSTIGTEIIYNGQTHQFILEPDDYAPGYWTISFVR